MQDYLFDSARIGQACVDWIADWFAQNGNSTTKALLGISGGKDSTVAAGLCVKALGKDRVLGILMPNKVQNDISDSQQVVDFLQIAHYTINIGSAYQALTDSIQQTTHLTLTPQYNTNTPARLRMTTLYGIGALVGNCRVINTCNRSEDVQGYSTHYGDSVGDVSPLCRLTTEEVSAIGDWLGIPTQLTHKIPSDGMCGKSDEDNLGWSYHEINEIIRKNIQGPHYKEIIQKYLYNRFKIQIVQMPHFTPALPDWFLETYGI